MHKKSSDTDSANLGLAHIFYDSPDVAFEDFMSNHNSLLNGSLINVNFPVRNRMKKIASKANKVLESLSKLFPENTEKDLRSFVEKDMANVVKRRGPEKSIHKSSDKADVPSSKKRKFDEEAEKEDQNPDKKKRNKKHRKKVSKVNSEL
ncbi:hypothetical protein Ciccas_008357 [Cichlidogyrus casuarinus]|uniref:Uncharacterized protein n=1 Tax=Cichlidogyrus casuarinus TaxID=1844966 RepID=A0ABD2Q2T7_9PLAT